MYRQNIAVCCTDITLLCITYTDGCVHITHMYKVYKKEHKGTSDQGDLVKIKMT